MIENLLKKSLKKSLKLIYYIHLFLIFVFVGIRYEMGVDYHRYFRMFEIYNNIDIFKDDIGFQALIISLKKFNLSPYGMFFVIAGISLYFVNKGIKNNSKALLTSLFIYFSLYLIPFNFTAVAQGISIALFLYSLKFMKDKNVKKLLVVSSIASLIHSSGLLILFSSIIYRLKLNRKKILLLITLGILLIFLTQMWNFSFIANIFPKFIKDIIYNYTQRYDQNVDFLSVLIRVIFILLIFIFGYNKFNEHDKGIFNIYIFSFLIYGIFSWNSLFATRINLFLKCLDVLLIPNVVYNSRSKTNTFVLLICFALMLFVTLTSSFKSITVFPYKYIDIISLLFN